MGCDRPSPQSGTPPLILDQAVKYAAEQEWWSPGHVLNPVVCPPKEASVNSQMLPPAQHGSQIRWYNLQLAKSHPFPDLVVTVLAKVRYCIMDPLTPGARFLVDVCV